MSALLDQVGIAGERRLPLRKFSKGMIQRVGIAQALINDPEVVFLDEPMSGLDPLGRRDVRNLILSLRDRGCTVFFSSHVLSDAEALCSRVAVLAHGKLVANGRISDLQAFDIRGWELIVSGLTPESLERHRARVHRVTLLGEHRYSLELPLEPAPELLLRDLVGEGAQLVSLNPIRETLEDFFVKKVAEQTSSALRRKGGIMTIGVIRTIAVSVFRESVRDKVLYNLVFFAVLLIAVSYLLSQLTAGQDMKVIKDLGLAAMSLFGLFIAVFIGIGLVSKEVEKRSIYALLAKPIRRQEFIIGKYLGLVLTLFVNLAIMAVAYYGVLGAVAWIDGAWFRPHWEAPAVDPALLKAIAMIFLQLAIVVAIALFFSTFSSPMLAAALTFGLYVVGHFNADLKNFESGDRFEADRVSRARAVLPVAEPGAARRQERRRARSARARDVPPAERGVQRRVRVDSRVRGDVHLRAARFQMTPRQQTGAFAARARRDARRGGRAASRPRSGVCPHGCRQAGPLRQQPGSHAARGAVVRHAACRRVLDPRAAALRRRALRSRTRERRYDLLYPLLDLATTLDPRFTIGYRFGAIFLAEPHPGGAGRPDQAIALLKKGVAFNPEQVGLLPRHRIHLLLEPSRLSERG